MHNKHKWHKSLRLLPIHILVCNGKYVQKNKYLIELITNKNNYKWSKRPHLLFGTINIVQKQLKNSTISGSAVYKLIW